MAKEKSDEDMTSKRGGEEKNKHNAVLRRDKGFDQTSTGVYDACMLPSLHGYIFVQSHCTAKTWFLPSQIWWIFKMWVKYTIL